MADRMIEECGSDEGCMSIAVSKTGRDSYEVSFGANLTFMGAVPCNMVSILTLDREGAYRMMKAFLDVLYDGDLEGFRDEIETEGDGR